MKFRFEKITTITCLSAMLVGMVLLCALKKNDFSEQENRYLASIPEFSLENLFSGEYMDGLTEYATDHFPGRDFFVSLSTLCQQLLLRSEINGVYIAKDDYLIREYEPAKKTSKIIETFNAFNDTIVSNNNNIDIKLMLVPTAVSIYADKLPKFAKKSEQLNTLKEITDNCRMESVDVMSLLLSEAINGEGTSKSKKEEVHNAENNNMNILEHQLFYRTDHHWTSYGAYLGYRSYLESMDRVPAAYDYFDKTVVSEDFHGTLSSRVNLFFMKADTITLFNDPYAKLRVRYADTETEADSLYNMDYLDKKDKYSIFLDNNHSLIEITNENASSDKVLMLIKDSYANCMVPFLVHDFSKIYVFDTRYYKEGPSFFAAEHKDITNVLILYNMNTIDTDAGIAGIY